MKKAFLALLAFATSTIAWAQKDIVVDPNAQVRTVNGSFTSIKVSGGIDIYLSQSDNEAVAVSASEEKYKERIKTIVENGTLNIYDSDKGWGFKRSNMNMKMKVYISFKTLEKLNASGASDVMVIGKITGESLSLNLSGASDFKGAVKLSSLKMDLSGASDVTIEGSAATVNIESSGSSDVKGYDLVTDVCTAHVSGSSDINITVNKELNAHASGSSDIRFKGNGLIKDVQLSGSSKVERKS